LQDGFKEWNSILDDSDEGSEEYIDAMKNILAKSLGVDPQDVGIKASTNEKMDWEGRKEGIGAHAVCLLVKA
jgi:2-C-methyl-D-erythritol 2,4-cyclodiphosphate synthase